MLPAAAIKRLYDFHVGTTPVEQTVPHEKPHKPLLPKIETMLQEAKTEFFVDPEGYNNRGGGLHPPSPEKPQKYFLNSTDEEAIHRDLEKRDYYIENNHSWVPALARWKTLQDCHARMRPCQMRSHPAERLRSGGNSAKLPAGTEIVVKKGKTTTYKITSTGKLIDDALEAVEKENPKLKNVLNKNYTQLQIDPANLAGLIDLIATIPFQQADLHAKDILSHVYAWSGATKSLTKESPKGERGGAHQYLLGQFALAEGKKDGQYFTPKSIVSIIVEMIEPYQGRVYDPAMGSGGFFVQSERFIEEHGGTIGDIMVFGQESNPTTWRLAAMNIAICGIDFDFGKEPVETVSDVGSQLRSGMLDGLGGRQITVNAFTILDSMLSK